MLDFEAKRITSPVSQSDCDSLNVGDAVLLNGVMLAGRDAVLPRIVSELEAGTYQGPSLEGMVIFHTAVSPAGIGPTSSNKLEIVKSMEALSRAGVRIHLGKGAQSAQTVKMLGEVGSVYAVTPPVSALFNQCVLDTQLVYAPELGMEALYRLEVQDFPMIIAAAGGESLYDEQ